MVSKGLSHLTSPPSARDRYVGFTPNIATKTPRRTGEAAALHDSCRILMRAIPGPVGTHVTGGVIRADSDGRGRTLYHWRMSLERGSSTGKSSQYLGESPLLVGPKSLPSGL